MGKTNLMDRVYDVLKPGLELDAKEIANKIYGLGTDLDATRVYMQLLELQAQRKVRTADQHGIRIKWKRT